MSGPLFFLAAPLLIAGEAGKKERGNRRREGEEGLGSNG